METTGITTTRTAPAAPVAERKAVNADYDMFLRMLTTQMQNQDPLNPIESADYAVQLATFSSVEQQTRTNQLMQEMIAALGGAGLSEHAGWVGKEGRSTAPVSFDGRPVTLHLNPSGSADRAVLSVRDALGRVVSREDIAPATRTLAWAGTDVTGAPLAPGTYTIRLESYAGETLLNDRPAETYARIAEVRTGTAGTMVVLAGGAEIAADQVTALRDPAG